MSALRLVVGDDEYSHLKSGEINVGGKVYNGNVFHNEKALEIGDRMAKSTSVRYRYYFIGRSGDWVPFEGSVNLNGFAEKWYRLRDHINKHKFFSYSKIMRQFEEKIKELKKNQENENNEKYNDLFCFSRKWNLAPFELV